MPKRIDLTGQVFSRLTVIKYVGKDKHKKALWECECECGTITIVKSSCLKSGNTKSCGCLNIERIIEAQTKHGHNKKTGPTPTYHSWASMKKRCFNPNNISYPNYGSRGIKVCDRWLDFNNFLEDMGEQPNDGKVYTIERRDNNKDYTPDNCYWLERPLQARNKRNIVLTKEIVREARQRYANGETVATLARNFGVNKGTLGNAIRGITWKDIA